MTVAHRDTQTASQGKPKTGVIKLKEILQTDLMMKNSFVQSLNR